MVFEEIQKRYEKMRRLCLQYGNLHPDDKSVCHQALKGARGTQYIARNIAELADDMMLALSQLQAENAGLRSIEQALMVKFESSQATNAELRRELEEARKDAATIPKNCVHMQWDKNGRRMVGIRCKDEAQLPMLEEAAHDLARGW
jgi:hypothetical protein